ncbi:Homogentisate 1,2-dioxygenase [Sarocladium strictum]
MAIKPRTTVTDITNAFHYTDLQRTKPTRAEDPYEYQAGFGNRHQSEVIPGALPIAQNNPQDRGFGLYTEGITYSAFAAPRHHNKSTYMYRARPSAAHNGYSKLDSRSSIENCFLSNNHGVEALPEQAEWSQFKVPTEPTDFTDGLHTLGGSGDPNLREGIALYIYLFNKSMGEKAFSNSDGDMLICPQQGTLDIQTELGMIYLQPGEIAVVPRGVRFSINLPDSDTQGARGYITEIWGSAWELPDLGPLGGHGLASPRDFLFPVAHIDDLEELHVSYTIVTKLNGKLVQLSQDHSPYDVVAWHGNVVPYKYDLTKFASQNATSIDHTDPSINTVLTARSHDPTTALADFLWFGPRWDVASNTFRLPYFHRNSASEFLACLYGEGLGRSDDFQPGGGSYEGGHTPHGGFSDAYVEEVKLQSNEPRRILENQMTIMIETSRTLLFTKWAREDCGTLHTQGTNPEVWAKLPDNFSAHPLTKKLLDQVKESKANFRKATDEILATDISRQ